MPLHHCHRPPQVDLNITADGGFAEFDFAFFVGGTFGRADETRATLRNVKARPARRWIENLLMPYASLPSRRPPPSAARPSARAPAAARRPAPAGARLARPGPRRAPTEPAPPSASS